MSVWKAQLFIYSISSLEKELKSTADCLKKVKVSEETMKEREKARLLKGVNQQRGRTDVSDSRH